MQLAILLMQAALARGAIPPVTDAGRGAVDEVSMLQSHSIRVHDSASTSLDQRRDDILYMLDTSEGQAAWDTADVDGDGKLLPEEFAALLARQKALSNVTDATVDRVAQGKSCTCWQALKRDYPRCSGYELVGYLCTRGGQCAACNPAGTPRNCAKKGASGTKPDPVTGKCETPSNPQAPVALPWHLAPFGATQCDTGNPANMSVCGEIGAQLAKIQKQEAGRGLQSGKGGTCGDGAWGNVPLGCSVQSGGEGDWTAHYKTSGSNCNVGDVYQLVCSGSAA